MFGPEWEATAAPQAPAETTAPAASAPDQRAMYLRWRPHRFEEVVGQQHVTRTLRNAVMRGKLAHAYLLTGPRGTGKTSIARIMYRAANCPNQVDGDPCNTCPLCRAALDGRAMDLVEIDAASNRGIDDIRDLREKVAYRPSEGRYRLYIIDEAHELTANAQDAFLKTLEEPPPHTIFVLATTEAHKVLPTIVSRCQRFDLRRIPFDLTRDQLQRVAETEKLNVDDAVLEQLARSARGGLRDALSLLDQLSAFGGGQVDMAVARTVLGLPPVETVRATLDALAAHDASALMERLLDVEEGGADLRQFAEELVWSLRGLLMVRAGAQSSLAAEFSAEELAWLADLAPAFTVGGLMALVGELSGSLARTRDSQQFQVQVELALLGACQQALGSVEVVPARAAPPPALPPRRPPAAATPKPSAPAAGTLAPTGVADDLPPWNDQSDLSPSQAAAASPAAARAAAPAAAVTSASVATPAMAEPSLVPEPPPATPTNDTRVPVLAIDVARVRDRWPDVYDFVKARNHMFAAMLLTSKPVRLEGDRLILAVGTAMNVRAVQKPNNTQCLESAFAHVFGHPLRVKPIVADESAGPSLFDDPVLSFAAKTFGGEPRLVEE